MDFISGRIIQEFGRRCGGAVFMEGLSRLALSKEPVARYESKHDAAQRSGHSKFCVKIHKNNNKGVL